MQPPTSLFDLAQLRRQRLRAATGQPGRDFLFDEAALRLADRLQDIRRNFPVAVDLAARRGLMEKMLGAQGKTTSLVGLDLDAALLGSLGAVADPNLPPLAPASVDLVLGCLCLHWVDDLPGLLAQIRRALKPGGLFLASMLGGGTLGELRQAFLEAESEVKGGAAPRVIPMADIRDLGGLLQRAGFKEPVADSETLTVSYRHPLSLLADLRAMGEGNALIQRSKCPLGRAVLGRMCHLYQERFGDAQGLVPARFDILTLTGWNSP